MRPGHYGIIGLKERARLTGGHFSIKSTPEKGTTVQLRLPLEEISMSQPIRVLITDDHFIVRQGLRLILNTADDIELVGEACQW